MRRLSVAHDLSKKINEPFSMNLAIHRTRVASREIEDNLHVESIVENINSYMKKVSVEFALRFDSNNIEILRSQL